MSVTFEMRLDVRPLQERLTRLQRDLAPGGKLQQEMLRAMGRAFVSVARRSFRDTSLQLPSPWPPYKDPNYVTSKKRHAKQRAQAQGKKRAGRTSMLIDTGTLFSSIIADSPSGNSIKVRSAAPYAIYHHFGTKHMPQRRFFPVLDNDELTPQAQAAIRAALTAVLAKVQL